jgi:hypothetical protein
MKINQKRIIIGCSIFAFILGIVIILFYSYREVLLKTGIQKVTARLQTEYQSKLTLQNAHFDGFSSIAVENVALVPQNGDTLFKIKKCRTSICFWKLFVGKIQLGSLEANDGYVQLIKTETSSNFAAYIKKKKTEKKAEINDKRNYAQTAYRIITSILNLIPSDLNLKNLTFKVDDIGKKATIYCLKMTLENEDLESDIKIETPDFTQKLRLKGTADPRGEQCDISFFNLDTGAIKIPYIKERFGISASFNSVRWNVNSIDMSGDDLLLDGVASVKNLKVNHPRIALADVVVDDAEFDYKFILSPDQIAIDSTSEVRVNKLKFKPYCSINTQKDTIYRLGVHIPKMPALDYISSLPTGLFDNIKGMKTTGDFDFRMAFSINKNKPNQVTIDSKLNKYDLKILEYGAAKLDKINSEFEYRAIINDQLQRPIFVGVSNPNYTPLDSISPYLQKCVLTTEDPSFMTHKGFVTEAFRTSIIKNLQTKKFSRGGSTISMQLVKNVFLTRQKTLSRKLEEILLVFILENNQIVNKKRMLEVYFNVIEWGPDVYGIGEASQFYFQKKPKYLSLNECLFLANIIPSPRKFMFQFGGYGSLSGRSVAKNNYITNLMIKRKLLDANDIATRYNAVNISGKARSFLIIRKAAQDTVVRDSIMMPDDDEFEF